MNVAKYFQPIDTQEEQRFVQGENVETKSLDGDSSETTSVNSCDEENMMYRTCAVCHEVFNFKRDLVKHAKQFHPHKRAFKCRKCDLYCCSAYGLLRHMKTHNYYSQLFTKHSPNSGDTQDSSSTKKRHLCKYCFKTFSDFYSYKMHLKIHTDEHFLCSICKKTFKQKEALKKHQKSHLRKLPMKLKNNKDIGKRHPTNSEVLYENDNQTLFEDNENVKETQQDVFNTFDSLSSFSSLSSLPVSSIEDIVVVVDSNDETENMYDYDQMILEDQGYSLQNESLKDLDINFRTIDNNCAICQMHFFSKNSLLNHAKLFHPNANALKCRDCDMCFDTLVPIQSHRRTCHKGKKSTCEICCERFESKGKLLIHMGTHTEHRPFACNLCGNTFTQPGHLKCHQKSHFKDTFSENNSNNEDDDDDERNDIGKDDSNLNDNSNIGEEPNSNNKTPQVQNYEDKHMECSTEDVEQFNNVDDDFRRHDNKCAICQKRFSSRIYLAKHGKKYHPNAKAIKCRECDKKFLTMWRLKQHFMCSHSPLLKKYKCTLCSKAFFYPSDLSSHQRVHYINQPVECFEYAENLLEVVDIRSCINRLVFKCACCPKVFQFLLGLDYHARQHHPNALAFQCPHCKKSFASTKTLSEHLQDHLKNHLERTDKAKSNEGHYCEFCFKFIDGTNNLCADNSVHKYQKSKVCGNSVVSTSNYGDNSSEMLPEESDILNENDMNENGVNENDIIEIDVKEEEMAETNNLNLGPTFSKTDLNEDCEFVQVSNQDSIYEISYVDKHHEALANHCESLEDSKDHCENYQYEEENLNLNNSPVIKDEIKEEFLSDSDCDVGNAIKTNPNLNENNKTLRNSKYNLINYQDKSETAAIVIKNEIVSDADHGGVSQSIIEISQTEIPGDKSFASQIIKFDN